MSETLNKRESEVLVGVLPCSGACNVGNMMVKATGVVVSQEQNIQYVCALGLPLEIESIIKLAKAAEKFIALNGCEVTCSTKALEAIEITPDKEYFLTKDFTIKKNKNYEDETNLQKVIEEVQTAVSKMDVRI